VESKKAGDVVLLDMRTCSSEVDGFLICHGTSQRQVKAIAEAVEEKLAEQGERPLFTEGKSEGSWVLIDCGDLVVHVFLDQTREFYRLEDLWFHAPRIEPSAPEAASGR